MREMAWEESLLGMHHVKRMGGKGAGQKEERGTKQNKWKGTGKRNTPGKGNRVECSSRT